MVTRNDVARAAGVSSAVVSYVMNNGPRTVAPSTRTRVLAAVEELGYRPNSLARSMRTRRTNSLGLILPEIAMSYFSVLTQRITEVARERGLSVVIATSNGNVDVEREHLIELAARQVDGVILLSLDPDRDIDWVQSLGMPVLLVDRPSVAVESTALATAHLLEHGCSRMARVSGPADRVLTRRRDRGWAAALRTGGLEPTPAIRAEATEQAGYAAALEVLSIDSPPDGVVVDAPAHAAGFLRAAADLGLRVPTDVAVIVCEYGAPAEFTIPRLSSVDSPLAEIADQAVAAILAASPEDRLLRIADAPGFVLHERESCRGVKRVNR